MTQLQRETQDAADRHTILSLLDNRQRKYFQWIKRSNVGD